MLRRLIMIIPFILLLPRFVVSNPGISRTAATTTTLDALLKSQSSERWGWAPSPRADRLPDFSKKAQATRGAPPAAIAVREATVILGTPEGSFGSGVFLSSDGWILTNYHVVAEAAQVAALTGGPARMRVFHGKLQQGEMRLESDSLFARVYRVNPVVDLALLKVESKGTFPSVHLAAKDAAAGSECFVIGSQGAGFPWLFRSGKVLGIFDFPKGLTEVMIGADTVGTHMERTRLTIAVSDCPISPGDSGGPLVDAGGNLIGLTFATPANLSSGSMGLHVSLKEIRKFTASFPPNPEGIPFDPWVVGLPFSMHAAPQAGILREGDQSCFVLQYVSLSPNQQPLGELLFFDLNAHNKLQISGSDTLLSMFPTGIWGMEERKGFSFDVFLARRYDGLVALGYTDAQHIVNEIRLDANQDAMSDVVWKRSPTMGWEASIQPLAVFDEARLGQRGMNVLAGAITKKQ